MTAAEGSRPGGGGAGSVDPDRQRILGVLIIVLAVLIGVILVFRGLSGQTATEVSSDPSVQTTTTVDRDAPPPTDALQTTTSEAPAPADVIVVVANGSGITGLAARTGELLTTAGYQVLAPTDATSSATTSSVYFTSGSEPAATEVAAALGLGATAVKPLPDPAPVASVGTAQVVVVLGADFATPTE